MCVYFVYACVCVFAHVRAFKKSDLTHTHTHTSTSTPTADDEEASVAVVLNTLWENFGRAKVLRWRQVCACVGVCERACMCYVHVHVCVRECVCVCERMCIHSAERFLEPSSC